MRLKELATVLRSKSAGPFMNTIDIFLETDETYRRVRDSGILTKDLIAELYHIRPEEVLGIFFVDEARGIKITVPSQAAWQVETPIAVISMVLSITSPF